MKPNYQLWSELPYAGENEPPKNPDELLAGSWSLFYLKRGKRSFLSPNSKQIKLNIKNPNLIDWEKELKLVEETLDNIYPHQILQAIYWGTGVATKQWTPIIDKLIDTYNVSAPRAARIIATTQAAINDTFVVVWYLKYKWNVARPNQLNNDLATFICTPRHPTYPSGHATMAGVLSIILSYYFPAEAKRLNSLANECATSRLYGGVHFPVDNIQGLRLGKQIGKIIVNKLKLQKNSINKPIDVAYTINNNADLLPPPYTQAIPYNFDNKCDSLVVPTPY